MARHRTSARDCELLASETGATPEKMRLTSRAKTDPPPTAKGAARNTSELEVITSSSPVSIPASEDDDDDDDDDDDALVTILVDRRLSRSLAAAPDEAAVPAPPAPQPTPPPEFLVMAEDELTAPPTVPPVTLGQCFPTTTVRQRPFAGPLAGIAAPHAVGRCVMMRDAETTMHAFVPVHHSATRGR